MDYPNYTKLELLDWVKSNPNFNELFNKWALAGYTKDEKPSIDRLDDYKPYTLDNIQLMTWRENNTKGHADRMNGNNRKQLRGVIKYSLNDVKLEEYYSIRYAARVTGADQSCITRCCKGKQKTAGGYKWKYKETNK